MTKEVFMGFYQSLLGYYGKSVNDFTRDINNLYFKAFASVGDSEKDEVLEKIVKAFKFFPPLAELQDYLPKRAKRLLRNTDKCFYCMDVGLIPYIKVENIGGQTTEYEYQARCPMCKAGNNWGEARSYSLIFGDKALQDVYKSNISKYGNIVAEQEKEAKERVQRYISKF